MLTTHDPDAASTVELTMDDRMEPLRERHIPRAVLVATCLAMCFAGKWGLRSPDRNIDHRRVPNLQAFLERQRAALPVTHRAKDYRPGDLITCIASRHFAR